MKYMGSKTRLAKFILPIILKDRKEGQMYVEPFVGGCNMIDKVETGGGRMANDINWYIVKMFKAVQNGWEPPSIISNKEYNKIKCNMDSYPAHLVGFVGIVCSFGAKWFGGYARGVSAAGKPRNYALEGKNNILKQAPLLKDIVFTSMPYDVMVIPEYSIIYCDPPYQKTTKYKHSIDYTDFWEWCRKKHLQGHSIFISSYNAPPDFKCILTIEHKTMLTKNKKKYDNTPKKRVEKLFIPED